jgi:integrase
VTATVLAPVPVEDELARLVAVFDEPFWSEAGWDASLRLVRPAPGHPTLGWSRCVIPGCDLRACGYGGLCANCQRRWRRTSLSNHEFIAAAQQEPPVAGARRRLIDALCRVDGCPRPQTARTHGLCNAHHSQCLERFKATTADAVQRFLREPDVVPLPALGPCKVAACTRLAENNKGLCISHQSRWKRVHATRGFDFNHWLRTEPGISRCGVVNLRALPDLVMWQLLIAVQRRTRQGLKISPDHWDLVARHARSAGAPSLLGLNSKEIGAFEVARLLRVLQREARLAIQSWEDEQRRVVWDLGVIGLPGTLDFTEITQPWLEAAMRWWAAEELPRRRATKYGFMRDHIRSLADLSTSLRIHRDDDGADPCLLGRSDILNYLTRQAHRRDSGELTDCMHLRHLRQVKIVLAQCREAGLTRPGQCMAGLPGEFSIRRTDLPRDPDKRSWRSLPPEVIRALDADLPQLEAGHTREMRVAVELLMDTGRRPDEICQLPLTCLDQDERGPVLIYTDFKTNRHDRRLPISTATAELIRGQQQRVRLRYPNADETNLVLLPGTNGNPFGQRPIRAATLTNFHREWVDSLPPLLLDDGTPFPKSLAVPYAYRHSYCQRHADAGTPMDVLRDLMGHRSTDTTQIYYRVTESRTRAAVEKLIAHQYDGSGRRLWRRAAELLDSEHTRHRVGQIAVPFGICAEPSNVQAGGTACPFRMRCVGCGHFRADASFLPELRAYLDRLLADRERVLAATDIDEWARMEATPSDTEISKIRQLIHRVEFDLEDLTSADREQINQACSVLRKARQQVSLGTPTVPAPSVDIRSVGRT